MPDGSDDNWPPGRRRLTALLEVALLLAATLIAVGLAAHSPWGARHQAVDGRPFLEYLVMMAVPVGVLILSGRRPFAFGISTRRLSENVNGALICMAPYAAAKAVLYGAPLPPSAVVPVSVALALGVLILCTRLLPDPPTGGSPVVYGALPVLLLISFFLLPGERETARAVSAVLFYALLLGPGEEILFRGYIQSRLNQVYGRRWRCRGVSVGWGLPITAALFGLFHLLNLPELFAGNLAPDWRGGLTSAAWGLFFGYLREWSGSIVAPALVHGLPQGIASALLGR